MKVYLFVFLIVLVPGVAYAEQIGISLSKSCIIMIQNEMDTVCPSYEEIMMIYPDNTNQEMVGAFEWNDGMMERGKSQLSHPERFYDYHTGTITWIDPPSSVMSRIKMIYIEPSLPAYKTENSYSMSDYTVSFGKDRYINPNCSEIRITAENWVFLLGDTIHFINNSCDYDYTQFNGTMTINIVKSFQDITTSYKYQLDSWIAENLLKCKVRYCI